MKNILFAIVLTIASLAAHAQGFTDYKEVSVDGKRYVVEYVIRSTTSFVPATADGQPHYDAKITVYQYNGRDGFRKLRLNKRINAVPIEGTYVQKGCFEDRPEDWVRKSFNHHPKKSATDKLKLDGPELLRNEAVDNAKEYVPDDMYVNDSLIPTGIKIVSDSWQWGDTSYYGYKVTYDTIFGMVQTIGPNDYEEDLVISVFKNYERKDNKALLDYFMRDPLMFLPAYQVTAYHHGAFSRWSLEIRMFDFNKDAWNEEYPILQFIKRPKKK